MENNTSVKSNMLEGSIFDKLIFFAFPLAASSILQQLFNSVDVAIAGRFAGSDALAAVGANTSVIALFVNLFVGLSIGTNVVIATFIGQKKKEEVSAVVHTSLVLAFVSGVIIMLACLPLARIILHSIGTPDDIINQATVYFRIYLLGMPFILLYNFGAAVFRSIGNTRVPMIALTVSGVINIILNIYLVKYAHMGVAGVAIATVVSNIISTAIVLGKLSIEDEMVRLDVKKLKMEGKYLKKILSVGVPAGVQSAVFSLSNVFVQAGINSFGSDAIAGSSTGLNFEYFTFYISSAFTQAAVTFSSQNFGAGNIKRCRKIARIALVEGVLFTEMLSAIFVLWRVPFVHLYTLDEPVVQYAIDRMMRVMALEGMTAVYEVTGGVIRSMGRSLLPAILTIIGSVGFRIVWIFTVFEKYHTFRMLMWVYPVSWIFNIIMMLTAYYIVVIKGQRK